MPTTPVAAPPFPATLPHVLETLQGGRGTLFMSDAIRLARALPADAPRHLCRS